VSRYQKGKTNLNFTEARDSEWQWHQLGRNGSLHLSPDIHQHPTTQFFTGRMPFLQPNQQRQSTERHQQSQNKINIYEKGAWQTVILCDETTRILT